MTSGLRHTALFYEGTEHYLSAVAEFAGAAIDAGAAVLVAVPGERLSQLRDVLPGDGSVEFADMSVAGRNPGRILPWLMFPFASAHPGRPIAVLGEPVWPGRTALEYPACAAHEALINVAFADRAAEVLCPYDVTALEPFVLAGATGTHPVLLDRAGERPSSAYADPLVLVDSCNVPLPTPPPEAAVRAYSVAEELAGLRRFVGEHAARAGLGRERTYHLTVAVNELATNTLAHTEGPGTVAVWREEDVLVCQVADSGRLVDPLAGRIPRATDAAGGRGLLLVNELCDLVRVHAGPEGLSTRLHVRL
jgi:anti-sigma regulatory factor (Ser/Thr protein kinase)